MRWLVACFLLLMGGSCIAETKTVSKVEFTYPDFNPCYEKNKASIVYFGKIRAVAISEKYAIAYTKEKPTIPFVKYDPLMHIYLFESSKPLIPVKLKSTTHLKLGEWLASMSENSLYTGTLSHLGTKNHLLEFGTNVAEQNTIMTGLCCDMYGLGIGGKSFIGSDFLMKFMESNISASSPIGADLNASKTALDNVSQANATPKATPQKTHLPETKTVSEKSKETELFLHTQMLFLTDDLVIKDVKKASWVEKSGLKVGDKLLQVGEQKVETSAQASNALMTLKKMKQKEIFLLFERNQFQFFVTYAQ